MIPEELRRTVDTEGYFDLDELMIVRDEVANFECKVENPKVRSARRNISVKRVIQLTSHHCSRYVGQSVGT